MTESVRIAFVFIWIMMIGVALVFLRTHHLQSVYQWTCLYERQHQVRQAIWEQHRHIACQLQHPQVVRQRIEAQDLAVTHPGLAAPGYTGRSLVRGEAGAPGGHFGQHSQ